LLPEETITGDCPDCHGLLNLTKPQPITARTASPAPPNARPGRIWWLLGGVGLGALAIAGGLLLTSGLKSGDSAVKSQSEREPSGAVVAVKDHGTDLPGTSNAEAAAKTSGGSQRNHTEAGALRRKTEPGEVPGPATIKEQSSTAAGRQGKEAPMAEQFVSLFNGKDLNGWAEGIANRGRWAVEDGLLKGTGANQVGGGPGILTTQRSDYDNFRLRLEVMSPDNLNKIIHIRAGPIDSRVSGYLIAIGGVRSDQVISIGSYSKADRIGWIDWNPPQTRIQRKLGRWSALEITANGKRIVVEIDGAQVLNYEDNDRIVASGHITLNCQSTGSVAFRTIEIKELK
jgi:hypothetical protein